MALSERSPDLTLVPGTSLLGVRKMYSLWSTKTLRAGTFKHAITVAIETRKPETAEYVFRRDMYRLTERWTRET
jgi:hypothetical protein